MHICGGDETICRFITKLLQTFAARNRQVSVNDKRAVYQKWKEFHTSRLSKTSRSSVWIWEVALCKRQLFGPSGHLGNIISRFPGWPSCPASPPTPINDDQLWGMVMVTIVQQSVHRALCPLCRSVWYIIPRYDQEFLPYNISKNNVISLNCLQLFKVSTAVCKWGNLICYPPRFSLCTWSNIDE